MIPEMLHIEMAKDRMIFILVGYGILMWAFGFAWGRIT